jgi:hypothetical protein
MGKVDEIYSKLNAPGRQTAVDKGLLQWNPSMLEGDAPTLPGMGTGIRPAYMPKWAEDSLGAIRAPGAAAIDPPQSGGDVNPIVQALRAAGAKEAPPKVSAAAYRRSPSVPDSSGYTQMGDE